MVDLNRELAASSERRKLEARMRSRQEKKNNPSFPSSSKSNKLSSAGSTVNYKTVMNNTKLSDFEDG